MVETVTPAALPITVLRRVWTTAPARASTRLSPPRSVRTNTMPEPVGAGRMAARTRWPECRPTPAKIAGPARVCWCEDDMLKRLRPGLSPLTLV